MFKKTFFLSIIFCCFFFFDNAQTKDYPLKRISTFEELSQSSAIAIHQDNFGQIWIGTRDGLNKYDGKFFTVYRNTDDPNSISNNDILSITQDSNGYLWIGTYNGLNKFDLKKNSFTNYFHEKAKNSLSNNTIWCIKEMKNGEIWIGTSEGLSILNKKTNTFLNLYHNPFNKKSIGGNQILSIFETENSEIFVGTNKGLSKLVDRKKNYFHFFNYDKIQVSIQDILQNKNSLLLASKGKGILNLNLENGNITSFLNHPNINKNVRKLCFDDTQNLWIGTYDGLFVYHKNKKITVLKNKTNSLKSLSKNSVKSLFKDKKGSIWIGTYYGGINIWDKSNVNFTNITSNKTDKNLSYNVVSAIEDYKNQKLFIATEGKGINVFNLKKQHISQINKTQHLSLSDENIKSLLVDKNFLWVGTLNAGINLFNIKKNLFENEKISKQLKRHLTNTGVYSIKKDKNKLWLATFGKGLICYDINKKSFRSYNTNAKNFNTITNDLIRTIKIDSQKNIWVGSQKGLSKIDTSNNITRFFFNSENQFGEDITTIFESSKKEIWVGTKAKGLFKFNGTSFDKKLLKNNKETITSIHSLLEDKNGCFWISTNQGIVKYNPTQLSSTIYNIKDGLVSNEFNDNASLKLNEKLFYFGSPNGITYFNTNSFTTNYYVPQTLITNFKINNTSLQVKENTNILRENILFTKELELSYKQGNFTIEFAIPNFINPKNNLYQYRLKGLDKDWIYTTNNTASFTIQTPGNYVFEVKGANNDGLWNQKPTSLKIKVNPAPWRSWWAFSLYGLIIAVALYFLINVQKSKTKLKLKLELEQLANEKIEETNKAKLEFFTNISHEFRTPLTLILGPLKQILNDFKGTSAIYKKLLVVENNANHLLLLINRLMDFRKFENNLFKIEAAEGNIVKFLREIYFSFSEYAKTGDYTYTFEVSEETILVYYDRYKLERVFFNLISNAFRYTPKGGEIHIVVKKENKNITIAVEDSGVGISDENKDKIFDRFFEIAINNKPENTNYKGTGIGLSIAKNIVKLHKGIIKVSDNKNGNGTIFTVNLPLGRQHLSEEEIIKDFKFSDDVSQYVNQLDKPVLELEDKLENNITKPEKETILLVEDNKPLRKFIKQLLIEDYNIIEAENGIIGLKKAIKYVPNLIVSDVIMPEMVGTELCATIKKDIKTSHIPIILLTSRTSLIYRLDGLESGADDYISKPFNLNEFKLRIKNILLTQQNLRERFNKNLQPVSSDIVSSLDEKLFKKALKIVNENISNEDFNIPFFCSELGVSRTMLFVKIKAWTNFTPNEFILHLRMKRAAELLEKSELNIAQISDQVGYKNAKYFSKSFLKKYGETPSQYKNKFSDV